MTSTDTTASIPAQRNLSSDDELLILFAKLMEGGQEDDETVRELDQLSKVLNEDAARRQRDQSTPSVCRLIDVDCVDTMLGYLDMRQADVVRAHAIVAVASYLSAAGQEGERQLSNFFLERVRRGTYDDYIVAFSVAAATFAVVPDLTTRLFLSEGFLSSLGPLMRRKWKSRKVETACLDMLNVAAGVSVTCRDAIRKYCCDWLEEIVDQDPEDPLVGDDVHRSDPDLRLRQGSIAVRRHSDHVQNLAAVILTKISVC